MKKNTKLLITSFIMFVLVTISVAKLILDPSIWWVITGVISFVWLMVFEIVNFDRVYKE